jgi:hypothetical protein
LLEIQVSFLSIYLSTFTKSQMAAAKAEKAAIAATAAVGATAASAVSSDATTEATCWETGTPLKVVMGTGGVATHAAANNLNHLLNPSRIQKASLGHKR